MTAAVARGRPRVPPPAALCAATARRAAARQPLATPAGTRRPGCALDGTRRGEVCGGAFPAAERSTSALRREKAWCFHILRARGNICRGGSCS